MTTRSGPWHDRPDPGLDAIMSERRRLINLRETRPAGWLRKVASRICLNLLGSARARRETYVGAWLPEPLPDPAEWPTQG